MVMTGGGAGSCRLVQNAQEQSFGLNIHLPFEQEANPIMAGDPKLIKLHFFHPEAISSAKVML